MKRTEEKPHHKNVLIMLFFQHHFIISLCSNYKRKRQKNTEDNIKQYSVSNSVYILYLTSYIPHLTPLYLTKLQTKKPSYSFNSTSTTVHKIFLFLFIKAQQSKKRSQKVQLQNQVPILESNQASYMIILQIIHLSVHFMASWASPNVLPKKLIQSRSMCLFNGLTLQNYSSDDKELFRHEN